MIYGDYGCIDAIAFSPPCHYLETLFFRRHRCRRRRSYLLSSLGLFLFLFSQPRCPVHLLIRPLEILPISLTLSLALSFSFSAPLLTPSYSQPGKFIFSRVEAFPVSFSKACREGSSVAIPGPFTFVSPTSELYTRYIMNIAISRRSYTVRSFLKWKTTRKVGRGLRATLLLPTLESSYRLSRPRVLLRQHLQP